MLDAAIRPLLNALLYFPTWELPATPRDFNLTPEDELRFPRRQCKPQPVKGE
jgi:hypothetical protein